MHLKHFRLTVYHWLLSLTSCWLWSKKTKLLRKSWTSSTRMAFPSTIAGERTWYVWHELIRNHERTINKLKNSVTQLRLAMWGVNDKRWHLPIFWFAKLEMSQIVRQKSKQYRGHSSSLFLSVIYSPYFVGPLLDPRLFVIADCTYNRRHIVVKGFSPQNFGCFVLKIIWFCMTNK